MNALFSCLSEVWAVIKKRKIRAIAFAVIIVVGVVLGIVLPKQTSIQQFYLTYCRTYTQRIYSSSAFALFFRRLLSSVLLLILIIPLFFTLFYLPVAVLIVFYKAFTFGVVTVILFSSFGISGFFVWLICALPVAIFLFAATCVAFAASGEFCNFKIDFSHCFEMLPYFTFLLLCAVLCALLECVLAVLIFRPVSKIF